MFEVDEAARNISSAADTDANIIFGAVIKPELNDQIKITVVATGFDETRARLAQFSQPRSEPQLQGVVSEKPHLVEAEDQENGKDDSDQDQPPTDSSDDVFGEKFEIPAFLRKIS